MYNIIKQILIKSEEEFFLECPSMLVVLLKAKLPELQNLEHSSNCQGGDTGLIHISEIANTYVKDVGNYLKKE